MFYKKDNKKLKLYRTNKKLVNVVKNKFFIYNKKCSQDTLAGGITTK